MSHARRTLFAAVAALTLGLAPFGETPHLVGKIRWVAGGAKGMELIDWFDLVLHAAPWIWLAWELVGWGLARHRSST